MPRAAGRIQDPQIPWVFPLPRLARRPIAQQVRAALGERRRAAAHLKPGPTKGIVGQELDDVPRREELIAHRELPAIPRSLALVPHPSPLLAGAEELVNPPERLVVVPDLGEVGRVDQREQLDHRLLPRPVERGLVPPIEESPDLGR